MLKIKAPAFLYHMKDSRHCFALCMAFILVLSVCTASMPCQKKKTCSTGNVPGAKTCSADSSQRHLHSCQLKKVAAVLTDSFASRTEKKTASSHRLPSALIAWLCDCPGNMTEFRMAVQHKKPPGHSPSIILVTSSLLC